MFIFRRSLRRQTGRLWGLKQVLAPDDRIHISLFLLSVNDFHYWRRVATRSGAEDQAQGGIRAGDGEPWYALDGKSCVGDFTRVQRVVIRHVITETIEATN